MRKTANIDTGCRGCAAYLLRTCCKRHPWFRLVREPLAFGMRALAWLNGIKVQRQALSAQSCDRCIRYMKTELQEKSLTFRLLNAIIAPWFGKLRNSMLTPEEFEEARRIAREARIEHN